MRNLKPEEIQCRAQIVKENGFSLLLYKDARCDMNILDETYGEFNWRRSYEQIGNSIFCTVSVYDKDKEQWVSKQDVGSESNMEAEKGQASDAFKRACFNWGIGRELYTAPFIWIQAKSGEVYKRKDGKYALKSSATFKVQHIKTEDGVIQELVIIDDNLDVRFKMGASSEGKEKMWLDETKKVHWMNAEKAVKSGEVRARDLRDHYKVSNASMEYFETLEAERMAEIDNEHDKQKLEHA